MGNQFKFTGAAFKCGGIGNPLAGTNVLAANADWTINKDFDLTLVYAKTKEDTGTPLKTWAAGFGYNGIQNIGLTFEYGKNSADAAKNANGGSDPKAWMAKAKYLGADGEKPQTYGLWVGYRKADEGFTNNTTLDGADQVQGNLLANQRGFEYGFEYTLFKNGILTLQYNNLKGNDNNNTNGKNFISQLVYSF